MNHHYYQSSIPLEATEKFVSAYREEGHCDSNGCGRGAVWLERREYWLAGTLVGTRQFEKDGSLSIETALQHGKYHGNHYRWYDNGVLEYARTYVHGKQHGMAYQWDPDGVLVGSSSFEQGTGFSVWWQPCWEGDGIYLAEFCPFKDGEQHGIEWWLNEDHQTVYIERYFWQGGYHGIERRWDDKGQFFPEYPKYFIHNLEVDQATYIAAARTDPTLPKFNASDQHFQRDFPQEVTQFFLDKGPFKKQ